MKIFDFPASMASSQIKAKSESDVTPADEETLDFDDDTLKGNESFLSLARLSLTLNVTDTLLNSCNQTRNLKSTKHITRVMQHRT